nr:MAG TPA: hypothetical protein [Caudoviricetes sp.]
MVAWGVCGVSQVSARGLLAYLLGFGGVWRWRRRKRLKTLSQLSTLKRRAFASSKQPSYRSSMPTRASVRLWFVRPGRSSPTLLECRNQR